MALPVVAFGGTGGEADVRGNASRRFGPALAVGLIDDAYYDEPAEIIPWAVLDGVNRLIGADSVQLTEIDWTARSLVQQQFTVGDEHGYLGASRDLDTEQFFRFVADTNFRPHTYCMQRYAAGDLRAVARWSDFYTDLELAVQPAKVDYFWDVDRAVAVCLPAGRGRIRRLCLMREKCRDFTARHAMLLRVLRPHIHEVILHAEGRRAGVPMLTARKWQVLQLAGEGLSNAAIGQRLYISTKTVRKHMEHIFDRLGVRNRVAAAATALPHRPTMPPGPRPAT
jgi:DNA-binding CsgD family transcriptional regulator